MIKIRAGFIQDMDGDWINIQHIKFFHKVLDDGWLINVRFNHGDDVSISNYNSKKEAQEVLDGIMDSLDYIEE